MLLRRRWFWAAAARLVLSRLATIPRCSSATKLTMLPLTTAAPCVAQVLEGGPEEDLEHLALLLQFLEEETAAHRNFEFVQVRLTTTGVG